MDLNHQTTPYEPNLHDVIPETSQDVVSDEDFASIKEDMIKRGRDIGEQRKREANLRRSPPEMDPGAESGEWKS